MCTLLKDLVRLTRNSFSIYFNFVGHHTLYKVQKLGNVLTAKRKVFFFKTYGKKKKNTAAIMEVENYSTPAAFWV